VKDRRYPEALKLWNEAISAEPNNYKLYTNRANVHIFLKDYESALRDALRSASIQPTNNGNAHYTAARALMLLERHEEALLAFQELRISSEILPSNIDLNRVKKMEQECRDAVETRQRERMRKAREEADKRELEKATAYLERKEREAKERAEREARDKLALSLSESAVLVNSAMLASYDAGANKDEHTAPTAEQKTAHPAPASAQSDATSNALSSSSGSVIVVERNNNGSAEKGAEPLLDLNQSVPMDISAETEPPKELDDPTMSPEEQRVVQGIAAAVVSDALQFAVQNAQ
jgi:tetratricopeptide (TPR) repeat protein